jgi:phage repressor protein C with HTH and peptisase S24 domain
MSPVMNARRLIEIIRELTALCRTQEELAKALKVTQPTISRWLRDVNPQVPDSEQRDRIVALARKKGILEPDDSVLPDTVPIVGYAGAGGGLVFSEGQGPFGEAPMPPSRAAANTVAVVVQGDSMAGLADDGWMVYYDDVRDPPSDALLGKLCVVGLTDGRVLIKKLIRGRGPGHYDLYSTNGPVLVDQAVDWAPMVTGLQQTIRPPPPPAYCRAAAIKFVQFYARTY